MEPTFSFKRIALLLKMDLSINYKPYLVFFGLLFIVFFITANVHAAENARDGAKVAFIYFPVLLAGGLYFTANIFKEFRNDMKRAHYLSIPASHLEKLISKWLLSAIFFLVIGVIGMTLFSMLTKLFLQLVFAYSIDIFNVFNPLMIKLSAAYLALNSLFFLGAVQFNKYPLFLSLASVILISMFLLLIIGLSFYINFNEFIEDGKLVEDVAVLNGMPNELDNFMERKFPYLIRNFCYFIIAPFLLLISYFILKEKEA